MSSEAKEDPPKAEEEAKVDETAKAEETKTEEPPKTEESKKEEPPKAAEESKDAAAAVAVAAEAEKKAQEEAKERKDNADLTRRLQKLALERQKENKHDRLKVIQADKGSVLSSVKSFQELNLPKHLLDALFAMGFDRPSAIQEEALPRILADPPRNLIGQAQSGRYDEPLFRAAC